MKRISRCMLAISCVFQLLVAGSPADTVQLDGREFSIPPGFQISKVAGPPLVMRPICADFDPNGDLYVADSSGSNEDVQTQLRKKPHRIVRLRDTDGDGVFDQSIVFADRMMFPEGMLCHDGAIYVAAPPSIWKLTDTDRDGVADERVEWFQGKTLTGCANDLHGPYAGPDGWIYWCKGAFARQTYDRPGRAPWSTRAAHIFRRRPEGGIVEPVMTGGMDNPVELVFTDGGERLFTTTFLQHPAGGQRDGLIHAIYGGVYGKMHSVIDEHPRTGDLMPVLTHLGAAAPCGLCRAESTGLDEAFRGNLFSCLFNMHKVMRHELRVHGATFQSQDHDFLVCHDLDFHPTDVLEDADGSLVVIDTGGWYKLCCPTSQLQKPDVLGAIYRVQRSDATAPADARGRAIGWDQASLHALLAYLADPRPAVRRRAALEISSRGAEVLPELNATLRQDRRATVRLAVVWAAVRIDGAEARAVVRLALDDTDDEVRQAAAHGVSLHRDQRARQQLQRWLLADGKTDVTDQNRRAAAEALGRLGHAESVPSLIQAIGTAPERALEHSLTFALIEIGDPAPLESAINDPRPTVRRAAMMALDQMSPRALEPQVVIPRLVTDRELDRTTAFWIVNRHPDWDQQVTAYARGLLHAPNSRPPDFETVVRLVPVFARQPAFQELLSEAIRDPRVPFTVRRDLLAAMARCGIQQLPPTWSEAFLELLATPDDGLGQETIAALVRLPRPKVADNRLNSVLRETAKQSEASSPLRLRAAAAVQGGWPSVPADLFDFLRGYLESHQTVVDRHLAVQTLSAAKLSKAQIRALLAEVRTAGPMDLGPLLATYEQTQDPGIGQELVSALRAANATSSLPPSILVERTKHFGPEVSREVSSLLKGFEVDTDAQREQLQKLLKQLPEGDVRRGQRVFHGTKAACAACHAMGYLGGTIGPDLTRIGRIRQRRDLLEAIVFPNASFIRSYEPLFVITDDGKVINGIIKDETDAELTLIDGQRQEIRIPRDTIDETRPGKVSVMPSGLDQQLSLQQLADLLAFLQDAK